jgi:hypothetical protein
MSTKEAYEEFEFPDEKQETKASAKEDKDDFDFDVEDDTPAADRNRDPMPQSLVDELNKDELEDYSENVKTKLKQMKKVWHDERREKERALREQQEAINFAQKALEENKHLKNRLSHGERNYLDTYKNAAALELEAANTEFKSAYDMGDPDLLLKAQQKIADANYKLQKAKEYVPSLQQEETPVNSVPQVQPSKPDSKSVAWQERNTWFGKDEEMTSLALGLHQKLVNQNGDSYPSTDEYWRKVDETMRLRFPEYFTEEKNETQSTNRQRTERSSTVVAPANRSTSSKRIVLKQSEIGIAKKLGLTPEQYAREKMKMEANNG